MSTRKYAILANSQEELNRFLGIRGIISNAKGLRQSSTEGGAFQSTGDFVFYGELEEDQHGKKREGLTIDEAIQCVVSEPNRILCITSIEEISSDIQNIYETLEKIHNAGGGLVIRFSSRALKHRFKAPGEHRGWIWIGDSLESFIEQVKIAADFDGMFNPNPWAKISNSEVHQIWDRFNSGHSNAQVARDTGRTEKTIGKLRKKYKKLESELRKS